MWTQVSQSLHESMARVISRIATLLPGMLAFIVAVLFFAAIAWLLAWLVRVLLSAIRIDERLARGTNAIAEWSPTYTPTILITRSRFLGHRAGGFWNWPGGPWRVLRQPALGPLAGLHSQRRGRGRVASSGQRHCAVSFRGVLIGAVNMNLHYARLLSLGIKWLVLVFTAAMVLDHLSIGTAIVDLAFGILFGGIVLARAGSGPGFA